MTAREATMREIATALGVTKRGANIRALREGWPYREQRVRGGRRRLYPVASLPADVREALGESDERDLPPGLHADVRMRQPDGRGSQKGAATAASARPLRMEQDPLSDGNGCPATSPAHPSGMKSGEGAPPNQETPTLIPSRARTRERAPDPAPPDANPALEASLMAHFERLTARRRAECEALAEVFDRAVKLAARSRRASMLAALERAAAQLDCERSPRTLYAAWLGRRGRPGLKALPRRLWAAVLAPRYIGCTAMADCSPQAWGAFKGDYLRAEQPTAAHSHRLVLRLAQASGWTAPRSAATFLRRLRREVPAHAIVLARQGPEALDRMRPSQRRDRVALQVMEALCADGHRWDVLVAWPDGKAGRPVLVAWQDIRSGKLLGWRIAREETSDAYRLSLADVLWKYGAPEHVIVDNGRGIAAKHLTGGSGAFRGKALPDDPVGLLTQLIGGDRIHWTTPYSGQSKPIERAFRDLASDIAKDIRLAGAYTGKDTLSKPHNHGSKAIPLEAFRKVVADGIAEHNARRGRRGLGMEKRSFDEVFEAGMAGITPRRLPEAQLARWLLASGVVTARKADGAVALHGNRYWSRDLATALVGQSKAARKVVVRYDPERLDRPVTVERADGSFVARAEVLGTVAFFDTEAAKATKKAQHRARKAAKAALELHTATGAGAVAEALDSVAAEEPEAAESVLENVIAFATEPDPGREEEERLIREGEERILAMAFGGG